jgi:uncharacterized membrane protein YesL
VQRQHVSTASQGWVIRLYDAADEVFWAAKLNLLWLLGTVAGLVVLGAGPATVAAYTLARRRALGESFQALPAFVAAYRRELPRGTALLFSALGVSVFLGTGAAVLPRSLTLAAGAAIVVIMAFLLPMAVHYDVRATALLPKASLFALTHPAPSLLLLFLFTAVAYASALYPFLLAAVSVGGWIQLDTWLCLRFFAENEERLRAERMP